MNPPKSSIRATFEAWYELEMPRIFRYICYRVQDKATAEELTAATCFEAIDHLDRYDPSQGDFGGWMFGLARNVVARHFRSRSRHPQTISLDSLPELSAPDGSPEQTYELKEIFLEAQSYLTALSDQEQEVIALRYGAELSSRGIAEVMGISEGYVRVLLHRALKTLRGAMRVKERT